MYFLRRALHIIDNIEHAFIASQLRHQIISSGVQILELLRVEHILNRRTIITVLVIDINAFGIRDFTDQGAQTFRSLLRRQRTCFRRYELHKREYIIVARPRVPILNEVSVRLGDFFLQLLFSMLQLRQHFQCPRIGCTLWQFDRNFYLIRLAFGEEGRFNETIRHDAHS